MFYPCNMILLRNNCVNLHRPMELQLCMLALLTCVLSANFFISMFVIHLGMSLVTLLRNICMNFHRASRSTGTAMVLHITLTCCAGSRPGALLPGTTLTPRSPAPRGSPAPFSPALQAHASEPRSPASEPSSPRKPASEPSSPRLLASELRSTAPL